MASKLIHDIPVAISEIGEVVSNTELVVPSVSRSELIGEFLELPALLKGEEVKFEFKSGRFSGTGADDCDALGLSVGGTVDAYCTVNGDHSVYVYARGEIARTALKIARGSLVTATGKTVFGKKYSAQWTDEGPIRDVDIVKGIELKQIETIQDPTDS